MWIFRRYKKKLEKKFVKEGITRCQFNFTCDVRLIARLKLLAKYLDSPVYPLAEHVIEAGIREVSTSLHNRELIEDLQHHILKSHLLADTPDSE